MKLIIDSANRPNKSETSTNFNVHLKDTYNDFKSVRLSCFKIPLSWYNINSTNQSCKVLSSSVTYTVTPHGRFTNITDLLTNLKALLDAEVVGVTFTITQDQQTGIISVSTSSNVSLIFESGGIWELLGFTATSTVGLIHVASNAPLFYSLDQYLRLSISNIQSETNTIDNLNVSTSFIVPLDNVYDRDFGEPIICNFDKHNIIARPEYKKPLSNFRVVLTDQKNNEINLNGCDWYVELDFI